MALILVDRVKETTTTTGTGSVTLAGAFGGFRTFSSAVGNGNSTYYAIENETRFEIGIGTYNGDSNTLSRDTVLKSSSGGSKINLSGLSVVFSAYPADKGVFLDENSRLSFKDTNVSLSGVNTANINSDGDVGISGLLTLRRTSAGNFFHAYVDDITIERFHSFTTALFLQTGSLALKTHQQIQVRRLHTHTSMLEMVVSDFTPIAKTV